MSIKQKCIEILKEHEINPASNIEYEVNGEVHPLSLDYIIDAYMQASDESKLVFLSALKKSTDANEMGINKFFEGMGQLLLMTHLSDKFDDMI